MKAMLAHGADPEGSVVLLRTAIRHSELPLVAGALASIVGAVVLAVPNLWRRI